MENKMKPYEHSQFIDENGILLDDNWHELRDEEGCAIHIPEKDWKHYKVVVENIIIGCGS